jgi:hypothetical protein
MPAVAIQQQMQLRCGSSAAQLLLMRHSYFPSFFPAAQVVTLPGPPSLDLLHSLTTTS